MPNYRYKAINEKGNLVQGTFTAFSEADIEQKLQKNGLMLIKSRRVKEGVGAQLLAGRKTNARILIEFYRRLSQTLSLGLPILSGLEENANSLPSSPFKKIVGEIHMAIEGGKTLYEAMGQFPKVFSKLDLAIIRLGEQTGVLPKCLKELSGFLEWKEEIRSTIKQAAIYPAFVIVILFAVIGVWVGYVLPQMAVLLNEMGVSLPQITQNVLSTSYFFRENWPWIMGVFFVSGSLFYLLQKTQKGQLILHKYVLEVPFIGKTIKNIALARLSHNFATMYMAGMTINNIFDILTDHVLGNRYLEAQLAAAFREIQGGESITSSFEKAGGFPPLLLGAIQNGESTGTLDAAFNRLGDYYDVEVKRSVKVMVNAIEPLTIVILGGVFGLIILSILLPLYDVLGKLGGAY